MKKITPSWIQVRRAQECSSHQQGQGPSNAPHACAAGSRRKTLAPRLGAVIVHTANPEIKPVYSVKAKDNFFF